MPTLGFLKKKRTKESPGITSPTSSQATSPITPTSSRGFDNSIASISSQSTVPQSRENEVLQTTTSRTSRTSRTSDQPTGVWQESLNDTRSNSTAAICADTFEQQHHHHQQQHKQNSPSISNLIHPPQNDGASQSYPTPPASSQTSLHPVAATTSTISMDSTQRHSQQQVQAATAD
ncbi:hypothetical protein DID88_009790 [Monilinia fructigena]|uniref:Uncharacterized protein n=1 Tax=Monilinia fructigena TaxID=38457 RepID=A0A395IK38_9HELO|nr:hypothetical protein DID88_009790 [Monilinia fructigena]